MTMMDERIARRRRAVHEDRAARRLRRILLVLAAVGTIAFGLWFVRSPFLSVREVEVEGAGRTDPAAILAAAGVGVGTPMLHVDAGALGDRLLREPWIADASVRLDWPSRIVVRIVEHVPAAILEADGARLLVAADGSVLGPAPVESALPVVRIPVDAPRVGDRVADPWVLGALEFVAASSPPPGRRLSVTVEDDELRAELGDLRVRLGRPDRMTEKAVVLDALVAEGIPDGSTVDLLAPRRPAVAPPPPEVEGGEPSEGEVSG